MDKAHAPRDARLPIEDYAVVGDLRTAALIGKNGSIDWFCAPRFDSGACFANLLGDNDNGRWRIAPVESSVTTHRRYRSESLVLETEHVTPSGRVRVTDWMPIHAGDPVIARVVEGIEGSVSVESRLSTRFDYGCVIPWVRRIDGRVILTGGPDMLVLTADLQHERDADKHESSVSFTVGPGEKITFQIAYGRSFDPPPAIIDLEQSLAETDAYWRDWAARCTYHGEFRDHVVRSLLTLKALSFAPTGGIVAAATTSLPETIGGSRNWDYRFCWLRDATFTLLALIDAGFHDEADAWRDWLVRAVAGDAAQLQVLYGVAGERRIAEFEVPWLAGYANSRPVRIGNAASGQFQLDIYGETVDALMQVPVEGGLPEELSRAIIYRLVDFVAENRDRKDSGMWEIRGEPRAYTHSRVMAWAAFDRGVALARRIDDEAAATRWQTHRDALHAEICEQGFDTELNSFVQSYGSKQLDASTLLIPLVGFLPADDPRVQGTVAAIENSLLEGGFVLRYNSDDHRVDGLEGHDNVFLACSFWLADTYAAMGRIDDARTLYRRLLSLCNDVGLLAEEYDVQNQRLVGNFPQAFSHVGMVNTGLNIAAHSSAGARTPCSAPRRRKRMSDGRR